jgi:DNA polymerase III subunit epsilon
MTDGARGDWTTAPLVALDLEGSGAQDHDDEAILEIAVVPITAGQPDISVGYSTLINPGRMTPRRHWISPGLTTTVLAAAPGPAEVEQELARRVNGHVVVGHNVAVDWRLLHRRYPAIAPAALIDTLRLARRLNLDSRNSLSALTAHLGLTAQVEALPQAASLTGHCGTPRQRHCCCRRSSEDAGHPAPPWTYFSKPPLSIFRPDLPSRAQRTFRTHCSAPLDALPEAFERGAVSGFAQQLDITGTNGTVIVEDGDIVRAELRNGDGRGPPNAAIPPLRPEPPNRR